LLFKGAFRFDNKLVDLLTRMAQTNVEYGKIPEDETDFPDVWMDRSSKRTGPFEDEA